MRKRGCLYWATVDKRRLVLVLSINARNDRATDVIVIPCSANLLEGPTHIRLARAEGGVPRACTLKCEQITTLKNADVDDLPLGAPLDQARLREIERAVARAIGIAA